MFFNLLSSGYSPFDILVSVGVFAFAILLAISIHEFAHAYVADKLGDPTARQLGRVTLNPLAHLDPIGTITIILIGFGWGKPVPFNPLNLKNPARDSALISFAGPASNIILSIIFASLLRIFPLSSLFLGLILVVIRINLMLALFNLLPIHPLDGFKIVLGFLPPRLAMDFMELSPYGLYILLFFMFTPLLDIFVGGPLNFLMRVLVG